MPKQVIEQTKEKMAKAIHAIVVNLASIRAGRANASLLDKISLIIMVHQHQSTKWLVFLFLKHVYHHSTL